MDIEDILRPHIPNEGQAKLLGLLKMFDAKCRKFGITYYLGGGTALGAVRHGGFLPWDDDVDLYIARDEYKKLVAHKDEFFDDDFVMVSHETFPSYRNVLVRLIDTGSTAITKARIADDAPKGQFLELFILDPMPIGEKEQRDWFVKHWIYNELLALAFKVANNRIFAYLDYDLYEQYVARCEKEGTEKILKELEEELFSIKESDAKEYCSRWGLRNLIYDIDWFGEPRYMPFEDTVLPVPSKAERVLRFDYGDSWMFIPDVDEQITHSIASDMNVSYKYYLDDFMQDFDYSNVLESYPARKKAQINRYRAVTDTMLALQALKEAKVELEAKQVDLAEVEDLLKKRDYDGVLEMLNFWDEQQISSFFWQVNKYLDIGDDLFACALTATLKKGNFSKVLKLFNWRKAKGDQPSEAVSRIGEYANNIRNAYIAVDTKDMDALEQNLLICAQDDMAEDQFNYRYLKAYLDTTRCDNNAESEIGKLLADYPENGEIMALMGDVFMNKGNKEEAVGWYIKAFENTSQGLVRLHIKDALRQIKGE